MKTVKTTTSGSRAERAEHFIDILEKDSHRRLLCGGVHDVDRFVRRIAARLGGVGLRGGRCCRNVERCLDGRLRGVRTEILRSDFGVVADRRLRDGLTAWGGGGVGNLFADLVELRRQSPAELTYFFVLLINFVLVTVKVVCQ
ncbi:MAG: hypothetical protein QM754_19035 [Tepidisphaeraceae bacterium]